VKFFVVLVPGALRAAIIVFGGLLLVSRGQRRFVTFNLGVKGQQLVQKFPGRLENDVD
jgi:hypothetical protein